MQKWKCVELRLFHRLVKRDIYQIFTNFEEKDISKQTKLCRVKLKSRYHKNDKKRRIMKVSLFITIVTPIPIAILVRKSLTMIL